MYADADYVIEDLRVRGTPVKFAGDAADLAFAVQYFMSADLSIEPKIVHYPAIPDWFGIAPRWPITKSPGYGFGTDAHVTTVRNPPPNFPRPEREEHKGFTWSTEAAPHIRSLHLFRLDANPEGIADDAGKFWYTHLLEPLRASVVSRAAQKESA